ncbi:hypothetical protein [Amycolatopsis sp. VC5-11]|uniref:hypothetical protein n=1 Tax=Amycolatopsis sp. VC5-11 TaxID=3120156 RepID=UPI00300A9A5A
MGSSQISPTVKKWFIWSGPLSLAPFVAALVLLARMVPPPRPSWSAERIAEVYAGNQTGILVAAFVAIVSIALWANWAGVVIAECRSVETSSPFLTYTLTIFASAMFLITLSCPVLLGFGAYRAGEVPPEITRLINDAFWFAAEYPYSPFAAFMVVLAIVVFSDKRDTPVFPRWVGYFCLWCALLMFPGGMLAFFKTGPFAYDGLLAFYVLAGAYTTFTIALSVVMHKQMNRDAARERGSRPEVAAAEEPVVAR